MKKTRAKILITGYDDPVKGRICDIGYDGTDEEIVALLFRCAVEVCRNDLEMSDNQILGLFADCVKMSGDQDD